MEGGFEFCSSSEQNSTLTQEVAGLNRLDYLRRRLDPSMALIEIGPSHRPIAPKSQGWRTTVVDHASRQELLTKYANHQLELENIEDVDVIWSGGDLAERMVPERAGTFDAILASHVLEHMPDPISFLKSAQKLLKPSGLVILALPDKRYTFDYFGPMTTTADWLTAYAIGARTHSKRVAFNHVAYSVTDAGQITWDHDRKLDALGFAHQLADGLEHFVGNTDLGNGEVYHDYHAWRFTPSSFMLLILESTILQDIDLRVAECTPAYGHEFFCVLARGRNDACDVAKLNAQRLDLLRACVHELRQATELLLGIL